MLCIISGPQSTVAGYGSSLFCSHSPLAWLDSTLRELSKVLSKWCSFKGITPHSSHGCGPFSAVFRGSPYKVLHIWEVLNGVGVDGVGGVFPFLFVFHVFFVFFFVVLRFLSFFFAFVSFC